MTHREAKLIANELYKLMKKDIKGALAEAAERETDRYMTHREAAVLLCTTPTALYKDKFVPYTKMGSKRIYSEMELRHYLRKD